MRGMPLTLPISLCCVTLPRSSMRHSGVTRCLHHRHPGVWGRCPPPLPLPLDKITKLVHNSTRQNHCAMVATRVGAERQRAAADHSRGHATQRPTRRGWIWQGGSLRARTRSAPIAMPSPRAEPGFPSAFARPFARIRPIPPPRFGSAQVRSPAHPAHPRRAEAELYQYYSGLSSLMISSLLARCAVCSARGAWKLSITGVSRP